MREQVADRLEPELRKPAPDRRRRRREACRAASLEQLRPGPGARRRPGRRLVQAAEARRETGRCHGSGQGRRSIGTRSGRTLTAPGAAAARRRARRPGRPAARRSRRRARSGASRSGARAPSRCPSTRSGRTRGRARSALIPGPWSLDVQRRGAAGDRHRRPRRGDGERVREQVVEHLAEPVGADERRARRRATRAGRRAPSASGANASSRSATAAASSTGSAGAASARASASSPSTSRDSRSTSGSAPVDVAVLEPEPQRGERRAELVRGVGDEDLLRADELLEPPHHVVEGGARASAPRAGPRLGRAHGRGRRRPPRPPPARAPAAGA